MGEIKNKIICNNCEKEITEFSRICLGSRQDYWKIKDNQATHKEDGDFECHEEVGFRCEHCGKELDYTTKSKIEKIMKWY